MINDESGVWWTSGTPHPRLHPHPAHPPPPPPLTYSLVLATPPSCPFVTVLGGAIKNPVMCPLIFLKTRMRNVSRNVSYPNPALEISFGWLLFINHHWLNNNYSSTPLTRGTPSDLNNAFTHTHTMTQMRFSVKLTCFDVSLIEILTGLRPNSCLSF